MDKEDPRDANSRPSILKGPGSLSSSFAEIRLSRSEKFLNFMFSYGMYIEMFCLYVITGSVMYGIGRIVRIIQGNADDEAWHNLSVSGLLIIIVFFVVILGVWEWLCKRAANAARHEQDMRNLQKKQAISDRIDVLSRVQINTKIIDDWKCTCAFFTILCLADGKQPEDMLDQKVLLCDDGGLEMCLLDKTGNHLKSMFVPAGAWRWRDRTHSQN